MENKEIKTDKKAEKAAAKEERRQAKTEAKAAKEKYKATMKQEKKDKKEGKGSHKGLIAFLVVFILFLGAVATFLGYDYYANKEEAIADNVYFMTADLSGLTTEEAKTAIDTEFQTLLERVITLKYGDASWPYTAAQLGLKQNTTAVLEDAEKYTHSGNIIDRYKDRIKLYQEPIYVDEALDIDATVMDPVLTAIADEIGVAAKDASFALDENGDIYIVPEEVGVALDTESTKTAVLSALSDDSVAEVELVVNVNAMPERTAADLEALNVNGVLASFSTKYNAGQVDRSQNLKQASAYLDMTVVYPGETFSFNGTVGERTTARGFSSAMVIESGVYREGLGGGVCQVSTTLYGALLRTGLEVTERKHHTLTCSYVPPSQDAMVAWGSSDLCFKNNYDCAIIIHAVCGGGTISMTLYGNTEYKQEVELISDVVRYIPFTTETVTDNSLAPGETKVTSSGGRGLESYLYKKVYENGVEVSSETVNHDTYSAQKRIVAVGPSE
ncbi:MAG: VanW family protein [Bacillota bacterium]|nr:VanW family protein [Bacillota bacterium]